MTTGEGIKLLEKNGFTEVNQVGSHKKFKRNNDTITIVYHRSPKEDLHPKTVKLLKKLINN
jgi:predicted RNA binding protein YcfA (HicA-like mRNA interferase family)